MATANYPPPPTFLSPVGIDPATKQPYFEPAWLQWFLDIATLLANSGGAGGSIEHNMLTGLQGGAADEYYHLSQAEHDQLVDGPTTAVILPAVGASPFTYQNASGFTCSAVIVGGTPSNVEMSRDGATYYSAGVSRTITLGLTDYLRITYAVAPVLVLFPL